MFIIIGILYVIITSIVLISYVRSDDVTHSHILCACSESSIECLCEQSTECITSTWVISSCQAVLELSEGWAEVSDKHTKESGSHLTPGLGVKLSQVGQHIIQVSEVTVAIEEMISIW